MEELLSLHEAKMKYGISIPNWMIAINRKLIDYEQKYIEGFSQTIFLRVKDIEDFLKKFPDGRPLEMTDNEKRVHLLNEKISNESRKRKQVRDFLYDRRLDLELKKDLW